MKNGDGAQSSLLNLPLPPTAEREALPEFRRRIKGGMLGNGGGKGKDVVLDEGWTSLK